MTVFTIVIILSNQVIYIPFVSKASTALAIDSSTPPCVTGTSNLTTASFIPPDNAIVVVAAMSDEGSAQTFSVTDNLGSHLVYHNIGSGPYGSTSNDGRVQACGLQTKRSFP